MNLGLKLKNRQYLVFGGSLFLVFLGLLFLEVKRVFVSLDPLVTEQLQQIVPRILDVPLSLFSLLGSTEVMALLVLLLGFLVYRRFRIIPTALLLYGVIYIFEIIGKFFVYHPGPPKYFFRYAIPFGLPQYVQTKYSFPSGHVSRTLFILVVAIFLINRLFPQGSKQKAVKIILIALGVIMMVSRVYLGEHWTSDVIGGAFLGSAMGFLAVVYF